MRVKTFLGGLHSLDELDDEVNEFIERAGLSPDEVVDFKALSPDTGEISMVLLYDD